MLFGKRLFSVLVKVDNGQKIFWKFCYFAITFVHYYLQTITFVHCLPIKGENFF